MIVGAGGLHLGLDGPMGAGFRPGTGITRRFSVTGGILRLHTGEGGYLDFVRVE